jgi:Fic family protein
VEKLCIDDYRRLVQALKAPPMFIDLLPLIVKRDEIKLLLKLSEKELSTVQLSILLDTPQTKIKSQIESLFKRGFLNKRKGEEPLYFTKRFPSVISRFLSEG